MMIYSTLFAIVVGLAMIAQWAFSYVSGQIPELQDEPLRISFHIAAEMLTALLLILSGSALLMATNWAGSAYLVAMGMLFYTAVASPGYFAQKGEWRWLGFFALLIIGGLISLIPII